MILVYFLSKTMHKRNKNTNIRTYNLKKTHPNHVTIAPQQPHHVTYKP